MPSVKRTSFSTYQSYVTVVPRIIVHQCCSIPHSCNLVPIIPPGHNTSLVVCILSQPIVSFSEIIQDCPTPVTIRKFIYCIYRTYMYNKIMSFLLLNIKEISLQILEYQQFFLAKQERIIPFHKGLCILLTNSKGQNLVH